MGIETEHTTQYRYPGTKFFEFNQHNIFFGRQQETADLIHSIKAHDVFVIFADSGIGKTSLLNAGLIPELQKENIEPVRCRFQDTAVHPLKTIGKKLAEYCEEPALLLTGGQQKLWHLFKCCDFKNKLPIFILDQFEEFFNHARPDREECVTELADLINEYLPEYIRDEMREKFREKDPTPQELKYYTPARVKMLFLIRADKLKLLDDLSKKIPLILRNRFHLKPLNTQQAQQAILLPASLPQNGFTSPAFTFQPQAVTQMCNYLKNEDGEVESFQLQLLCQELEKKIIQGCATLTGEGLPTITEEELGGEAGMDNITKNYYTNQLNSIPGDDLRKKAVELIEDKLIIDERRISLPEVLLLSEGYSLELLNYLLNTTRLIRIDNDRYVEISHDRLLSSILISRQQRLVEKKRLKEAEELQRLKEEEKEKTRLVQKQKDEEIKNLELIYLKDKVKKAARLRVYLIMLILLLGGFLYAWMEANNANIEAKIELAKYRSSQKNYEAALATFKTGGFFNLFGGIYSNKLKALKDSITIEKEKYDLFISSIKKGDLAESNNLELSNKITFSLLQADSISTAANSSNNTYLKLRDQAFDTLASQIKRFVEEKDFAKPIKYYLKAQEIGVIPLDESLSPGKRLEQFDKTIADVFSRSLDATSVFLEAKDFKRAQIVFDKATELSDYAKNPENSINLNPDDTLYLNTLHNKLNQQQ